MQTVLKFVVKKFRKGGGGVPHMLFKLPMPGGVVAGSTCMYIFLCLWLSGAEFVVHVSAEVWLALGVFEGEERTGIVRFL